VNICELDTTKFGDSLKDLVAAVDTELLSKPLAVAQAVRMSFHDCVSKCNGVIDLNNPNNIGLNWIVARAQWVWSTYKSRSFFCQVCKNYTLTLADVFALFGARAICISSSFSDGLRPVINFRFGRVDATIADNVDIFTQAVGNWDNVKQFFKKLFGYNNREIIAIMGAHGLGKSCDGGVDFQGAWVSAGVQKFNNQYFKNMVDNNSKQMESIPYGLDYVSIQKGNSKKYQWISAIDICMDYPEATTGCKRVPMGINRSMLNADMSLLKQFDVADLITGKPSCSFISARPNGVVCPDNTDKDESSTSNAETLRA